MIRPFCHFDSWAVANIHVNAFNNFFLTRLGKKFLEKYYTEMAQSADEIFLVKDVGKVRGFVCGLGNARQFNRYFARKHFVFLGISVIKAILKHPRLLFRVATRIEDNNHFPKNEKCIHLLSIAVDPDCCNYGYGAALLKGFIDLARLRGYSCIYLTTDRDKNIKVNEFYTKNGFRKSGEYNSGNNRIMNEYVFSLE
jgi:ribosomal protein S18 acetylase RimI-like enzyme